nr:reverse transcriptase domain-containing protein [Tanacetum cinerariifolium]
MSAMANTTPIVTTVTKTATKEKTSNGAETAYMINILDFCEEHYEDILSVMDKIRRDKRREVHTRLDFKENSRKSRIREDSQNSTAKTLSARYRNPSKRPQIRDRLKNNDGNVFGRLGHRREKVVLTNRTLLLAEITLETKAAPTTSKNHTIIPALIEQGKNIGTVRVWFDELPPESIDGYTDLKAAFLAYFMQQKNYVKDPVEIYNIKYKNRETIEEFVERFKIKTRRTKGAPECMRIFGFMHGVNNPELIKRLNEHVSKTL